MMRIIIIEDELYAYEKLALLLGRADTSIEVVGHAVSVAGAVELIQKNPDIDLAFFDIQLADGNSFSIFDRIEVKFPVIFTTAYEKYAIRAFKHNSIDYLLKPIRQADLKAALDKYQTLWKAKDSLPQRIADIGRQDKQEYKSRFTINIGEHIKMVSTNEISCFYSYDKGSFMQTSEDRNYLIGYSLEELITKLDPKIFFRVSRKYIINLNYIKDNEKAEGENDPIGLILCAKKNDIFAKYVLGGLSNKVFASKYKLALPSEKELRAKLKSLPLLESKREREKRK